MLKNIGCLLVFVIFLSPADVYPYRPFITEDAGVSGLGEQKVEMGFVGSRQNEYWYNYISLLYGIGFGKAEILVETPYCINDEARGLEGIILAAKINVFEVDDTLMLGAKAGYEFPDDCYGVSAIATKKIGILVMHSQIGLKRAFNDTVGLFGLGFEYQLLQHLSVIIDNFTEYDVKIQETHHIHKLDAPSGTAIMLANDIIKHITRKKAKNYGKSNNQELLNIESFRENEIIGIHNIIYESETDIIELKHTAKNRNGLAIGAVIAAEWLIGKKGIFQMYDLLGFGNKLIT